MNNLKKKEIHIYKKEISSFLMSAVQDVNILYNKFGSNSVSVFLVKKEIKKIEKNFALAQSYVEKGNIDQALLHFEYAKKLCGDLRNIIDNELKKPRKQEMKKEYIPLDKVVMLLGMVLVVMIMIFIMLLS